MQTCMQQESGLFLADTQAQFESLMTRAWLRCDGSPMFARYDTRGFQLSDDGTWRFLLADGDGLVRGQGFENEGTWEVIDTTDGNGAGYYQLNLSLARGENFYHPTFSTTPEKIYMPSMGGDGEYVLLP